MSFITRTFPMILSIGLVAWGNMAYAAPDIEVNKTVDKVRANTGDTVQYTITILNKGTTGATGLTVSDALPSTVTYISDDDQNGAYNSTTGAWTIGSLAAGSQKMLRIVTTVN